MNPPTSTPRRNEGSFLTNSAARGAAATPPITNAATQCQSKFPHPRNRINPSVADNVTANSLVSTVPITSLGTASFLDNRTGVLIGPHPPPPIASKKPAVAPRGNKILFRTQAAGFTSCLSPDEEGQKRNRMKIYNPNNNKKEDI